MLLQNYNNIGRVSKKSECSQSQLEIYMYKMMNMKGIKHHHLMELAFQPAR